MRWDDDDDYHEKKNEIVKKLERKVEKILS